MNRAVSAVYAISIGSERGTGHQFTDETAHKLVEKIPALIAEINRMEELLADPFIAGYLASPWRTAATVAEVQK